MTKNRKNPRSKPARLDQYGQSFGGDKITGEDAGVTSNKEKRKWTK